MFVPSAHAAPYAEIAPLPLGQNSQEIQRTIEMHFHVRPGEYSLQKIDGGLTNFNYRLDVRGTSYFVRCRNPNSALLGTSISKEWNACKLAAKAGLAPSVAICFPNEGLMLSEFVEERGRKPDLRNPADRLQFCDAIRTFHNQPQRLPEEFCPFECVRQYVYAARDAGAHLPAAIFSDLLPHLEEMRSSTADKHKVPCHLDLHNGNLINNGSGLLLVDWEYSAMADPFFDLATAASIQEFTDGEMRTYLEEYLTRTPTDDEWNHFFKMRILADARWSTWCFLQEQISPMASETSFLPYAYGYLRESLRRLSQIPCGA